MQKNKHRNCLRLLFILMVTAFVCASCTQEEMSECEPIYLITVKAYDTDHKDITDSKVVKDIKLYVFDESNNYLDAQDATIDQTVELKYPGHKKLNVIVWGNSAGGHQSMPAFELGDAIETGLVSLFKTKATLPIAQSPDDLFHGSQELIKKSGKIEQTIPVYRKTSSVIITARKLKEYAKKEDNEFSFILRKSTDQLDFHGKTKGEDVSYAPPLTFNDKEEFVTPLFNILPASDELEIDIFHRGEPIATITADAQGNPFHSVEGKTLNILIDFSADITVDVSVTPWGEVQIWKEF